MADNDAEIIAAAVVAAATKPQSMSNAAGESASMPSVSDLIALEKHVAAKNASSNPTGGLRFGQFKHRGTQG